MKDFYKLLGPWLAFAALISLIFLGLWIWAIVWATQKKGWIGFIAVFLGTWVGWLIILLIVNSEKDKEKTRERERGKFRCGVCYIEYQNNLLGAETVKEGKICRWCLEKKQSSEAEKQ